MLILLTVCGCKRKEITVYQAEPSDATPAAPATPLPAVATAPMPLTMPAGLSAPDNSALPPLKYVLPAGWTEKPASQMRVASFGVSENGKTADISVIPLGGAAGGAAANVNRWRGQVSLPPLDEKEIGKLAEKISVGAEPADLYDLAGGSQRIIAVIFPRDETAWIFKMTGDATLVEAQKSAFISFLKTVQFGPPAR